MQLLWLYGFSRATANSLVTAANSIELAHQPISVAYDSTVWLGSISSAFPALIPPRWCFHLKHFGRTFNPQLVASLGRTLSGSQTHDKVGQSRMDNSVASFCSQVAPSYWLQRPQWLGAAVHRRCFTGAPGYRAEATNNGLFRWCTSSSSVLRTSSRGSHDAGKNIHSYFIIHST